MDEYIKRKEAIQVLCDACGNAACPKGLIPRCSFYEQMQSIPAADVVTRDCYDRILWENDIMRQQLADIGKAFAEKMDDVVCLDLSPICVGCDGKTVDGKTTDLCEYKTTYKRCFEQGKNLVDIAKAYFNGELVKRKHGKWVGIPSKTVSKRNRTIHSMVYICPLCRYSNGRRKSNFCPNCGADMRGEEDVDTD